MDSGGKSVKRFMGLLERAGAELVDVMYLFMLCYTMLHRMASNVVLQLALSHSLFWGTATLFSISVSIVSQYLIEYLQ